MDVTAVDLKAQENEKNSFERVQQWVAGLQNESKRLHFLNMNHADAGHGFHLRLAAQNSKEPSFVKMFS